MLKATVERLDYDDYRIFVGHYRNDPATAAAIATLTTPASKAVEVTANGPTTKANCLNHLYDALISLRAATRLLQPRPSSSTTPRTSSIATNCASSMA